LYLFILPFEASDKGEIANTGGDMPLGSQFGYLFPGAGDRTIAHEVGHGAFNLEHPFDRPLRGSFYKGALIDNLMDYTSGTGFAKIQWDQTRAPGLVIGMFRTDKSGMALNLQYVKDKVKEILKNLSLNSGQVMLATIIDGIYIDNFIDWNLSKWSLSDIADAMNNIKEYLKDKDVSQLMKNLNEILSKHSNNNDASQLMGITSFAWIENLQSKDINTATSLTNKMITSDKDAETVIFGLLFEFKYGIGPETREFGESSVLTNGIKDFYLVEDGREWFYKWRANLYFQSLKENNKRLLYDNPISLKNKKEEVYYPTFDPITGPPRAGLDLVKQYVGGFYLEFYPDEQGKQLEFVLYNVVNLKSLAGHYLYINELTDKNIFPEQYPRVSGQITPLGDVIQILKWKENITNERFNKYKQ